jgi:branched-chain amino acid transport system substrate-binding protein
MRSRPTRPTASWCSPTPPQRALAGSKAEPGTPQFRQALRDAIFSTKEVVGTHGVYNFKRGDIYGVDKRARVVVKIENSQWKLAQ